ncbi:hypothetical protein AVEN_206225-1 [Araneus ventricosus]|uniref:Uncharacterized protein n=1 Tax=Araneus ventricosus TaxID=182803 RepID=A0A4Y2GAP3_ARAVE|nr:hypothetical protein AVEN_206225-1 [Araneus ventricosus]
MRRNHTKLSHAVNAPAWACTHGDSASPIWERSVCWRPHGIPQSTRCCRQTIVVLFQFSLEFTWKIILCRQYFEVISGAVTAICTDTNARSHEGYVESMIQETLISFQLHEHCYFLQVKWLPLRFSSNDLSDKIQYSVT